MSTPGFDRHACGTRGPAASSTPPNSASCRTCSTRPGGVGLERPVLNAGPHRRGRARAVRRRPHVGRVGSIAAPERLEPAGPRPAGRRTQRRADHRLAGDPRLKRMQYRSGLLAGFLASTGLDFSPCNPHAELSVVRPPRPPRRRSGRTCPAAARLVGPRPSAGSARALPADQRRAGPACDPRRAGGFSRGCRRRRA